MKSKQVAYLGKESVASLASCERRSFFCKSDQAAAPQYGSAEKSQDAQFANIPGGVDCPACLEGDHLYGQTK